MSQGFVQSSGMHGAYHHRLIAYCINASLPSPLDAPLSIPDDNTGWRTYQREDVPPTHPDESESDLVSGFGRQFSMGEDFNENYFESEAQTETAEHEILSSLPTVVRAVLEKSHPHLFEKAHERTWYSAAISPCEYFPYTI